MIDRATLDSYRPQQAFLIQGGVVQYEILHEELKKVYEQVHALNVSRFTIEHADVVASFITEGNGKKRVCIVYFSLFSIDAAQVLLKSLEEPDQTTSIMFITPYPYVVPITIRSRVVLIQTKRLMPTTTTRTREEAFAYVKTELLGESEDDAATRRARAVSFLDELENEYKTDHHKADIIYQAKHMIFYANMPTKFVMEYVVTAVFN